MSTYARVPLQSLHGNNIAAPVPDPFMKRPLLSPETTAATPSFPAAPCPSFSLPSDESALPKDPFIAAAFIVAQKQAKAEAAHSLPSARSLISSFSATTAANARTPTLQPPSAPQSAVSSPVFSDIGDSASVVGAGGANGAAISPHDWVVRIVQSANEEQQMLLNELTEAFDNGTLDIEASDNVSLMLVDARARAATI